MICFCDGCVNIILKSEEGWILWAGEAEFSSFFFIGKKMTAAFLALKRKLFLLLTYCVRCNIYIYILIDTHICWYTLICISASWVVFRCMINWYVSTMFFVGCLKNFMCYLFFFLQLSCWFEFLNAVYCHRTNVFYLTLIVSISL